LKRSRRWFSAVVARVAQPIRQIVSVVVFVRALRVVDRFVA
jgi:hypothetical protein